MSALRIEGSEVTTELQRLVVVNGAGPVSFRRVVEAWRDDEAFANEFSEALRSSPFAGFRWECPATTLATLDRPFECMLSRCDELDRRRPDRQSFAEAFVQAQRSGRSIAGFPNLSGDAYLLAPRPIATDANYVHLASFLRTAPQTQIVELWRSVGETLLDRSRDRPLWLSTAGMGVAWLHIRFDDRPKYYSHRPYAKAS